jgi:type II secretory pathway predicted ATPase ExeA
MTVHGVVQPERGAPPVRPESVTESSGSHFETEARQAVFDAVVSAMETGTRAVLIEGDTGSGKSVFLSRLAATVPSACVLELRYPLGEADLCARLAQAFGATADGVAVAIAGRSGGGVLVAVDDADNLSPFALRMLLELQDAVADLGGRLALVLSAHPGELQRRIGLLPSFAPFRADRLAVHPLPALTDAEAEEQARVLARLARGIPGHIDRIAADLLRGVQPQPWRKTRGQSRRRRLMRTEWLVPAAIGAAAVAAIFLGYRVLFMPSNDRVAPLAQINPATTDMIAGLTPSAPPSIEEAETFAPEEPPVPQLAVAPEPEPPAQTQASISSPPANPVPPESKPTPAPQSRPAAAAPQPRAGSAPVDDRSWLLGQDPRRYTVQLASAPDEEKARQFIAKHAIPGRTIAVETVRGSFIVLHGSFASSAEAQQAIAGLPSALRRNDPFARRFESVRQLVSGN